FAPTQPLLYQLIAHGSVCGWIFGGVRFAQRQRVAARPGAVVAPTPKRFDLSAANAPTLHGSFQHPAFRLIAPTSANTPPPVLPEKEKFSFCRVLAFYQSFKVAQILLQLD